MLRLRVIKPDGRVLEPEPVSGKPTLTLPHLEVGDFIELEHVTPQAGDGAQGREYHGPLWFFREADKGYWQSEFVVISPADRELQIEAHGNVPPPQVKPLGTFVERRWRVDLSPPAELEPGSPPITEFLPTVRVGWGVSLDAHARAHGRPRVRRDAARSAAAREGARGRAGRPGERRPTSARASSTGGCSTTSRRPRTPARATDGA